MKDLRLFDKLVFILNAILAFGLLLSYLLPYVPPKTFPLLSVLSLGVPLMILCNIIFALFWALRLKKQFLLSFIVLLLGYHYVLAWFQFPSEDIPASEGDLSLMSYNVRIYNTYKWSKQVDIPQKINSFIAEKNPDVLTLQEHAPSANGVPNIFPYKFEVTKEKSSEFGLAIFSKYPIVNKGNVNFPQIGNNNSIWVDIVKNKDTLRIFNVHFQSLDVQPEINDLQKQDSKKLIGRIGRGFKLQQLQAEILLAEIKKSPYKTILMGDFNNTTFSYIYQYISEDRYNDAFLKVGTGFGQTFNLSYFPLRIDFMLIDKHIPIQHFEVSRLPYSDHFPIFGKIRW